MHQRKTVITYSQKHFLLSVTFNRMFYSHFSQRMLLNLLTQYRHAINQVILRIYEDETMCFFMFPLTKPVSNGNNTQWRGFNWGPKLALIIPSPLEVSLCINTIQTMCTLVGRSLNFCICYLVCKFFLLQTFSGIVYNIRCLSALCLFISHPWVIPALSVIFLIPMFSLNGLLYFNKCCALFLKCFT